MRNNGSDGTSDSDDSDVTIDSGIKSDLGVRRLFGMESENIHHEQEVTSCSGSKTEFNGNTVQGILRRAPKYTDLTTLAVETQLDRIDGKRTEEINTMKLPGRNQYYGTNVATRRTRCVHGMHG